VRTRRIAAGVTALAVLAATLLHDALSGDAPVHARSTLVLVGALVVGGALLVLVPRIRSLALVFGAGLAAGGAFATGVSGLVWSGVPDPLVRGGVAVNIADVAIALGDALLLAGALAYGWANRARLHEPV
jgi:hypothetical protein